jgi:hypothetical protein
MRIILTFLVLAVVVARGLHSTSVGSKASIQTNEGGAYPAHNGSCTPNCTPVGNYSTDSCAWYLEESATLPENPEEWLGRDFLSKEYTHAANCACGGDGDPAWLSPTASCVRTYLHQQHVALPNATKIAWREAYFNHSITGLYRWSKLALDPIYQMHQDAYAFCCCPDQVAPKADWASIFIFGDFLPCKFVVWSIENFGYCGCDGW